MQRLVQFPPMCRRSRSPCSGHGAALSPSLSRQNGIVLEVEDCAGPFLYERAPRIVGHRAMRSVTVIMPCSPCM